MMPARSAIAMIGAGAYLFAPKCPACLTTYVTVAAGLAVPLLAACALRYLPATACRRTSERNRFQGRAGITA